MNDSETDKKIQSQINKISLTSWKSLFDLIPEIENTREFGSFGGGDKDENGHINMPYYIPGEVVYKFTRIARESGILIPFDYMSWDEGRKLLQEPETNFDDLDLTTLSKLLTTTILAEKFAEGFLDECFRNGILLKILKAMEKEVRKG